MNCPCCGKIMVERYENRILPTWPPQLRYYWWCGGDGTIVAGGVGRGLTEEEMALQKWEALNRQGESA